MNRSALFLAAVMIAGPAHAQGGLGLGGAADASTWSRQFYEPKPAPAPAYAMPDPIMTPGAVDRRVDLNEICNGTTKHRRGPSTKICDRVFAAYSIPPADRYSYECDHDVPVALGGSTIAANLWPQPNAEAAMKDALEVEMQRLACVAVRTLTPEDAAKVLAQEQHEIAEDWPAAYRKYMTQDGR